MMIRHFGTLQQLVLLRAQAGGVKTRGRFHHTVLAAPVLARSELSNPTRNSWSLGASTTGVRTSLSYAGTTRRSIAKTTSITTNSSSETQSPPPPRNRVRKRPVSKYSETKIRFDGANAEEEGRGLERQSPPRKIPPPICPYTATRIRFKGKTTEGESDMFEFLRLPPASKSSKKDTKPEVDSGKTCSETTIRQRSACVGISQWLLVEKAQPLSSLASILEGFSPAIHAKNLDMSVVGIKQAKFVLSGHGRPTSWLIEFDNSWDASQIEEYARSNVVRSTWKPLSISKVSSNEAETILQQQPVVTDATIRVENCPPNLSTLQLLNMFSRFDLSMDRDPSIELFTPPSQNKKGSTQDATTTNIFLIHFADSSWARSALREKQGLQFSGHSLLLAPFPSQV